MTITCYSQRRLRPLQIALALLIICGLFSLFFKYSPSVSPLASSAPSAPISTPLASAVPSTSSVLPQPVIGKVSMVYGGHEVYERALATHEEHNRRHNYPMVILRRSIVDGVWNKLMILASTVTQELMKPEDERLQWLFWFDSDTVIMNLGLPLETFLPPPDVTDVHLIISEDWNGINSGNFLIRVHPWSVEFLTAALAYPKILPYADLPWKEQTAMKKLLDESDEFAGNAAYCPSRWFNPYRSSKDGEGPPTEGLSDDMMVHRGDLQVHFPGYDKWKLAEAMDPYIAISQQEKWEWNIPVEMTGYIEETALFWKEFSASKPSQKEQGWSKEEENWNIEDND